MGDNFDIHKWNKARYLSEAENDDKKQDPYQTATDNLKKKVMGDKIETSDKTGSRNKIKPVKENENNSFKDIVTSIYNGNTYFMGDHKVYFIQTKDMDEETFNKIVDQLNNSGYEVTGQNIEYRLEDGRKNFPYITATPKIHENKMTKKELEKQIREEILSTIAEKKKAKKDDAPETEETETETSSELELPGEASSEASSSSETSSSDFGVDPKIQTLQNALKAAYDAAKDMNDEKLTTQIGNTVTYFTRTHVVNDKKEGPVAELRNHIREELSKRIKK